jgi:hypothetical protein
MKKLPEDMSVLGSGRKGGIVNGYKMGAADAILIN